MWAIEDSPGPKVAYRGGGIIYLWLYYRVRQKNNPLKFFLQFSQQLSGISKQNFTDIFNHSIYT